MSPYRVLPDSDSWEGYECRTAGMVRGVIEKIAKATDEEPEGLLEAATRDARSKTERTKLEAEKVERDLRNMVRERLLGREDLREGSTLRGAPLAAVSQDLPRV